MIRGYVAFVDRDSPLPEVTPDCCKKAAIKLTVERHEFCLNIEETDFYFKVARNIRTVDTHDIASGLVRIGFIIPNLDIVISCNPGDLKVFVYTVEVIKNIVMPPGCSDRNHDGVLKCICEGPKFSQYQRYHISCYDCPMSVHYAMCNIGRSLCLLCCYRVLVSYNGDDALKIISTWNTDGKIAQFQPQMHSINVTSYPYLTTIIVPGANLTEIPEAIVFLPCLRLLGLSGNRLGEAGNWNWLTSPFIRENLRVLHLDCNGLFHVPEAIVGLRNLQVLGLSRNHLVVLPDALRKLKYLRLFKAWLYRRKSLWNLHTQNNEFLRYGRLTKSIPCLTRRDFSVTVPSLFQSVAKYIITERLDFWEYTIPAALTDYLEEAYRCWCGSVVFRDTISPVLECRIKTRALSAYNDNSTVNILLHCCSYNCYQSVKAYLIL